MSPIPALWLLGARAEAGTVTVCASGCDHTTVNAAVAAANDGDTIDIGLGTYDEAIVFTGRSLTLRGVGPGVRLGTSATRDTLFVRNNSDVVVQNIEFRDSDRCARVDGGHLTVESSTFDGCVVRSCCDDGSAILVRNGGRLDVSETTFTNNGSSSIDGGAIYVADGSLNVVDSTFAFNTARLGGAIRVDNNLPATILTSTFDDNVATDGGALHLRGPTATHGNRFAGNVATNRGGAVFSETNSASLQVQASSFLANGADAGGAIYAKNIAELAVVGSDFCRNEAATQGGAVYAESIASAVSRISATIVRQNSGTDGGGIYVRSSDLDLTHLTVLGNRSTNNGGVITVQAGSAYNRLSSSLLDDDTGNGLVRVNGGVVSFDHHAFGTNTPSDHTGGFTVGAGNLFGVSAGLTRYTNDADCTDDQLWPTAGSPLVDAGDPAEQDPDGTRSDIGAFGGPDVDPALDLDGDGVSAGSGDCDDLDPGVFSGAIEVVGDGVDQDCDGTEACYLDVDLDGVGTTDLIQSVDADCADPGESSRSDDPCPMDAPDDTDGDTVCDSVDACEGSDDRVDTDGDGVPDGCDDCPLDDPDDTDGDTVCDSIDTCPGHDDRVDADGDGAPDACDPCPDDESDDSDGDGVCDSVDLCPGHDDALDGDGDGVPAGCDPDDPLHGTETTTTDTADGPPDTDDGFGRTPTRFVPDCSCATPPGSDGVGWLLALGWLVRRRRTRR
ncbi:MAG: hypothetical protein H6738_00335 [Alphaproteobacteria bacterium]|nr:hypothetical protein [Alphaproteobacteria bacterium]MCB9695214.1 hypothetical protein [Alphaproteobacteria bacterium]